MDERARAISDRLNGAFLRGAVSDWDDVLRRAAKERPERRWRPRTLVLAGILVLSAGAYAGTTRVIPWLVREPETIEAPTLAPPCRAENLFIRLRYDESRNGVFGTFGLLNTGRHPCSLVGRLKLALVEPRLNASRALVRNGNLALPEPSVDLTPPELLRAIPPHQQAGVFFAWRNWCGKDEAPRGLEITLPSGDRVVRKLTATPRCENDQWRTVLEYDGFVPGWIPYSVKSKYLIDEDLPLRAWIVTEDLPKITKSWRGKATTFMRLRRGEVFRYRVALKNVSRRAFRFRSCPIYVQDLMVNEDPLPEIFVLNCRPAGTLAPGEIAYFAMELRVPADLRLEQEAPFGHNALIWCLLARDVFARPQYVWITD